MQGNVGDVVECLLKLVNEPRAVGQLVGYEPKVQLNEIITKVIDYFRTDGS